MILGHCIGEKESSSFDFWGWHVTQARPAYDGWIRYASLDTSDIQINLSHIIGKHFELIDAVRLGLKQTCF